MLKFFQTLVFERVFFYFNFLSDNIYSSIQIYLFHLVNIFQNFQKGEKMEKCCFLCSFKARECNDLRSWIFCEMIQLLPVDIAQKRDDKIVREIGDQ